MSQRPAAVLMACLACLSLAGCATLKTMVSTLVQPRYRKNLTVAIQTRVKGKRMIAVVYEGILAKDKDGNFIPGKRASMFRFDQTALLDKALVDLRYPTADRAQIETMLEAKDLPSTGSFTEDDLVKIANLTHADVIVIGYIFEDVKKTLLFGDEKTYRVILRAVDMPTNDVINSVHDTQLNDETWARLCSQLFHRFDI
jgi:hypothetical protein